jgi:ribosomal protein L37E
MKPLRDCLEELALRPFGLVVEEPRCGQCGRPEFGLVDRLCAACERGNRAAIHAETWRAAALADRAGTLAALGVPPKYREPFAEPAGWPRDPKVPLDVDCWQGVPWSLFLTGNTGVGKSFLATELLWRNHVRPSGLRSARFVKASRVPRLVFGGDQPGDPEVPPLVDAEILVIDELGLGHPGGGWEALDDVIGQRWEQQHPTIVTSRWTLAEVAAEAVSAADRLAEGLVVTVGGRSRRRPPEIVAGGNRRYGPRREGRSDERGGSGLQDRGSRPVHPGDPRDEWRGDWRAERSARSPGGSSSQRGERGE